MPREVSPVGGHVVAVLGQEVVADLAEEVERDTPTRHVDAVVCLPEQSVEGYQWEVATEEVVCQAVHLQQALQFLLCEHGYGGCVNMGMEVV